MTHKKAFEETSFSGQIQNGACLLKFDKKKFLKYVYIIF